MPAAFANQLCAGRHAHLNNSANNVKINMYTFNHTETASNEESRHDL